LGRKPIANWRVLECLADGRERSWTDLHQKSELGTKSLSNALKELVRSGEIERTVKGRYVLTKLGRGVLFHGELHEHLYQAYSLGTFPILKVREQWQEEGEVSGTDQVGRLLEQVAWHLSEARGPLQRFAESLGIGKVHPKNHRIHYG
jgi:predicted transcriptional regulator